MVRKRDQAQMRDLLTEAITVLCRASLDYRHDFMVEGLIGITMDNEEIFLININEAVSKEPSNTRKPKPPSPERPTPERQSARRRLSDTELSHSSVAKQPKLDDDDDAPIIIKDERNRPGSDAHQYGSPSGQKDDARTSSDTPNKMAPTTPESASPSSRPLFPGSRQPTASTSGTPSRNQPTGSSPDGSKQQQGDSYTTLLNIGGERNEGRISHVTSLDSTTERSQQGEGMESFATHLSLSTENSLESVMPGTSTWSSFPNLSSLQQSSSSSLVTKQEPTTPSDNEHGVTYGWPTTHSIARSSSGDDSFSRDTADSTGQESSQQEGSNWWTPPPTQTTTASSPPVQNPPQGRTRPRGNITKIVPVRNTQRRGFICNTCYLCFGTAKELRLHVKTHRDTDFSCKYCGKEFAKKAYMRQHIRVIHEVDERYRCICGKLCSTKQHLRYHMSRHHPEVLLEAENAASGNVQQHNPPQSTQPPSTSTTTACVNATWNTQAGNSNVGNVQQVQPESGNETQKNNQQQVPLESGSGNERNIQPHVSSDTANNTGGNIQSHVQTDAGNPTDGSIQPHVPLESGNVHNPNIHPHVQSSFGNVNEQNIPPHISLDRNVNDGNIHSHVQSDSSNVNEPNIHPHVPTESGNGTERIVHHHGPSNYGHGYGGNIHP